VKLAAMAEPVYALAALVQASGTVEELDGRAGVELLADQHGLLDAVRAIGRGRLPGMRFLWHAGPRRWLSVTAERERDGSGAMLVTIVEQERLPYALTPREVDVLTLVAGGLSNGEIAERLVVSPATARTHVSRAMVKLRARDRAQLVVFAYETGLALRTPPLDPQRGRDQAGCAS
jgi:DNA-binding NarL/FixJ family response regulator